MVGVAVLGFGDEGVDEVGVAAGDEHYNAHHEDPYEQLYLHGGILYRQQDKGDERNARHAIRFEAVSAGTNRIARIVASAVGNDAGIARVVFLDFEDEFHEVVADGTNVI